MSLKFLSPVILCAFLICAGFDCAAQTTPTAEKIPHVGTIKDYPATGLMTGCGNLYFYPAARAGSSNDAYVFLASGDGSNAWMNLDGRDLRLQQIKATRKDRNVQQYNYRLGKLRISVVIERFKPDNVRIEEEDSAFKMKITLRRGRASRVVRAVGDADC